MLQQDLERGHSNVRTLEASSFIFAVFSFVFEPVFFFRKILLGALRPLQPIQLLQLRILPLQLHEPSTRALIPLSGVNSLQHHAHHSFIEFLHP